MIHVNRRTVSVALSIAVLATAVASTAAAEDQVKVRFSWKLKGEYAPLYLAQERGFFKRENLDVRLGEGSGAQAALGALIQGQEDIVVLPGVFALSAIQKNIPVKLIAMYHPKTPVALITFPDKPARTPKDLEGMTVAHSVGETGTSYLDAFLKLNGVDPSKVKRTIINAQARVPAFIQRQVDVVSVYQTNDLPIMLEQQETKFVIMDMVEFGLSIPGLSFATSDRNIARKADILKRFLRASNAGVAEAKKNPMSATAALRKNWPNAPSEHAVLEQVKATLDAIPVPADRPIGWIDGTTVANTLQLLHSVGEIDQIKAPGAYFMDALLTN
jgi:NitT/TauT family transport system substrate-binding protein